MRFKSLFMLGLLIISNLAFAQSPQHGVEGVRKS